MSLMMGMVDLDPSMSFATVDFGEIGFSALKLYITRGIWPRVPKLAPNYQLHTEITFIIMYCYMKGMEHFYHANFG